MLTLHIDDIVVVVRKEKLNLHYNKYLSFASTSLIMIVRIYVWFVGTVGSIYESSKGNSLNISPLIFD